MNDFLQNRLEAWKWELLLFSIISLGVGSFFLFYDIPKKQAEEKLFRERGILTEGVIAARDEKVTGGKRRSTTYSLRIGYDHQETGPQGARVTVSPQVYNAHPVGSRLMILYMLDNPGQIVSKVCRR